MESDGDASLEKVFEDVRVIFEALINFEVIRNADDNAERAACLRDFSEGFLITSLALNANRPDKPSLGYREMHLQMLWAIFTVLRENDEYRPTAISKAAVFSQLHRNLKLRDA